MTEESDRGQDRTDETGGNTSDADTEGHSFALKRDANGAEGGDPLETPDSKRIAGI